jgi:hypothetical protein
MLNDSTPPKSSGGFLTDTVIPIAPGYRTRDQLVTLQLDRWARQVLPAGGEV